MLSVVIVNWNTGTHLRDCLDSLAEALTGVAHEIVVVDNASSDQSTASLERDFPAITLIQNQNNLGFAPAANQAAQATSGTRILFLNPDTLVSKTAVDAMQHALSSSPNIACVGPLLVDGSGNPIRECRRRGIRLRDIIAKEMLLDRVWFDWLVPKLAPIYAAKINRMYREPGLMSCLQGSCFLIHREDWIKLDGFDARVPMYLDDGDLCKRLTDSGRDIFFEPRARVIHYGGVSVAAMVNSRMTSLVSSLAHDVYFLKHGQSFKVIGHHLFLSVWSSVCLVADICLIPFLVWRRWSFLKGYLVRHFWGLSYGLSCRFGSRFLPKGWPRSLRRAWRADPTGKLGNSAEE